ncbi:hypothetical protein HETIRDRAFT_327342 [Heterobasidion irregulare TC 32-1]|uniref:AB hydrolase-1 domain-containing protein n=1 Tax=Heterobasidion irregulare (strain TC 32-1) TaxID=747525 RepID=W4JU51_HETIT|nr:uncharacterized protein HETIRDRAFT_327342 [Heterobasidion irregulare TC 32-1]ETW77082.1 hypothetical protein HETIRDRAFT_327342 [Heterobasidion irregulare TC 32-1]
MTTLCSESYVFDGRPAYPLLVPAKRYWHPSLSQEDGLTLILAHGTGFHKEHWEPFLDDLFGLLGTAASIGGPRLRVREAWAIDAPNHGAGALLNEAVLRFGYEPVFAWDEYALAIHRFLAGHGSGIPVDFARRRLVAVGHSFGAIALVLTRTYTPAPRFEAAVLVEPMLITEATAADATFAGNFLEQNAAKRRDVWPSREAARELFAARSFKDWDPRVLDLHVKHGLRDLPTLTYPDKQGVTLTCTKIQEAATYRDSHGRFAALRYLATFCADVPTHAVFGAIADYVCVSPSSPLFSRARAIRAV